MSYLLYLCILSSSVQRILSSCVQRILSSCVQRILSSSVQRILCCGVCIVFLRLVYLMLLVFLGCPF